MTIKSSPSQRHHNHICDRELPKEDIRRVDCVFSVAYDTDIAKAKDVLNAVAMKCPDGLIRRPVVGVSQHQASSVELI